MARSVPPEIRNDPFQKTLILSDKFMGDTGVFDAFAALPLQSSPMVGKCRGSLGSKLCVQLVQIDLLQGAGVARVLRVVIEQIKILFIDFIDKMAR